MANDVEATIIIPEEIILQYEKQPLTKWCCEQGGRYSNCSADEFCLHKVIDEELISGPFSEMAKLGVELTAPLKTLLEAQGASDQCRVGSYQIEHDRVHFWAANRMHPLFIKSLSKNHPHLELSAAYFDDCGGGGEIFIYKDGEELYNEKLDPVDEHRDFLINFRQADLMEFFRKGVFPVEEVVAAYVGSKSAFLVIGESFEELDDEHVLALVEDTCPNADCYVNCFGSVLVITDDMADMVGCKLRCSKSNVMWSYHEGNLKAQF